jgi:hypothetical protein
MVVYLFSLAARRSLGAVAVRAALTAEDTVLALASAAVKAVLHRPRAVADASDAGDPAGDTLLLARLLHDVHSNPFLCFVKLFFWSLVSAAVGAGGLASGADHLAGAALVSALAAVAAGKLLNHLRRGSKLLHSPFPFLCCGVRRRLREVSLTDPVESSSSFFGSLKTERFEVGLCAGTFR